MGNELLPCPGIVRCPHFRRTPETVCCCLFRYGVTLGHSVDTDAVTTHAFAFVDQQSVVLQHLGMFLLRPGFFGSFDQVRDGVVCMRQTVLRTLLAFLKQRETGDGTQDKIKYKMEIVTVQRQTIPYQKTNTILKSDDPLPTLRCFMSSTRVSRRLGSCSSKPARESKSLRTRFLAWCKCRSSKVG